LKQDLIKYFENRLLPLNVILTFYFFWGFFLLFLLHTQARVSERCLDFFPVGYFLVVPKNKNLLKLESIQNYTHRESIVHGLYGIVYRGFLFFMYQTDEKNERGFIFVFILKNTFSVL
jgi:hypothetical protein